MNPYKVLGVNEGASQDEIRAAYLALVKKYHPDKYSDNPLKELANEKLKEINHAYEELTKKTDSGPYGAYRGSYSQETQYSGPYASEFARARAFINQSNLNAARSILESIPAHNAEWHFLYGVIYLRQGWYQKARECIGTAYEMDPSNMEYRNAYASLSNAGRPYAEGSNGGRSMDQCVWCNLCPMLLCCSRGCCC